MYMYVCDIAHFQVRAAAARTCRYVLWSCRLQFWCAHYTKWSCSFASACRVGGGAVAARTVHFLVWSTGTGRAEPGLVAFLYIQLWNVSGIQIVQRTSYAQNSDEKHNIVLLIFRCTIQMYASANAWPHSVCCCFFLHTRWEWRLTALWTTRRQTNSPTDQLADKPTRRQQTRRQTNSPTIKLAKKTNSPKLKLSPKSM